MFNAYIGISPSFGANDRVILQQADSILQLAKPMRKYLYASTGTIGYREMEIGVEVNKMDSLIKRYPNNTLAWKKTSIQRTDHWSCVIPSLSEGLISMSRNYFADEQLVEQLAQKDGTNIRQKMEAYNELQFATFGFVHRPSPSYLRFIGDGFRALDNYSVAVQLYEWALEKDPNNVRAYVSIADTYDRMKNSVSAIPAFEKLQVLLEQEKENVSERFYKDISNWAKEKLEGYKN